jgi:hypothetical protein
MFTVDDGKLIILVQEFECVCSLQHENYDENFVRGKCLKETGSEVHDKKIVTFINKIVFRCCPSVSCQGTDQAFSAD